MVSYVHKPIRAARLVPLQCGGGALSRAYSGVAADVADIASTGPAGVVRAASSVGLARVPPSMPSIVCFSRWISSSIGSMNAVPSGSTSVNLRAQARSPSPRCT